MPSRFATSCAFDRSLEAIALTSDQSPRCIAGTTFLTAIFAVLRIPQRTLSIMLVGCISDSGPTIYSADPCARLLSVNATRFRQPRAAPGAILYENGRSTTVMDYQSILPKPIGVGNKIIRTIEDVCMLRAIKLQSPFHFRAAMWIRFHIPLN